MPPDQVSVDDDGLAPGTLLAGRYRIGELIGAGAMGSVYYAEHVSIGRPVAVKVLARRWLERDDIREGFRTEARSASAAQHPNIVDVLDAGELPDGVPWIVMEYLPGRTLYDVLSSQAPLDVDRAAFIGREIGRALMAAHARGIIHRDLKAENVMLVDRGGVESIKVLDFGVAHVSEEGPRRTIPGVVVGTPECMAPEAVRGAVPAPAFDVYALGTVLFEMLTGRAPFRSTDGLQVLALKTSGPAPSIATLRPDLPRGMVEVVDECLAMDPRGRPTSAQLVRRLDEFVMSGFSRPIRVGVPRSQSGRSWALPAIGLAVALGGVWLSARRSEAELASAPAYAARSAPLRRDAVARIVTRDSAPELAPATAEPRTIAAVLPSAAPVVDPLATTPERTTRPTRTRPTARSPLPTPPTELACDDAREQADQARATQDWDGLLRSAKQASCFAPSVRAKLQMKAYMELGRFDKCIEFGRQAADAEMQRWMTLCEKRRPPSE